MTTMSLDRYRTMKWMARHVREAMEAGALPEPLKAKLEIDLRDAVRRGFHVDLEQLELALATAR